MDFTELFTPAAIAANWTEASSNRIPYLGEAMFPAKKQAGLDLKWIKGNKGLPVSLMPTAFDAKATFRDRIGLAKLETEMPFFREGYKIKERDRQDILRAQASNDPYVAAAIARVFDDANDLIEGANVVPERERMQLLFPENGNMGIAIKANGVDYTYNYDPNGEWKASNYFTTDWQTSPSTADPFNDIQTAKDAIAANTGAELRVAVMNGNTFKLLRNNNAIKSRFLTTNGLALGYLTDGEIVAVLKDVLGLDGIIVYDKQYRDEDKVAHKFVPDGYVALLPAGAIGSTWYGTTPEEADLMGKGVAQVAIVNTGVALTQIVDPHPVNLNTFASEIVLPSYERMDEVALLKVV